MAFKHTAAHPGFKAVEAKIAKEPGIRNPGAVLAAASGNASPAAKKKNPRLNRVKGKAKGGKKKSAGPSLSPIHSAMGAGY